MDKIFNDLQNEIGWLEVLIVYYEESNMEYYLFTTL